MNKDYQSVLNSLKSKIEVIIAKYEHVISDNQRLSQQLELCREELKISNAKIKEQEEKLNRLQLAEAFTYSSGDAKEARDKIGRIVKEIDKCIALLND
jgi:hypothetical protein